MKFLNKIISYSVRINIANKEFEVKLKIAELENLVDISFTTLPELAACVELLRDENNSFYNTSTGEIHIIWEPVGENDPKHKSI
jgi:hypothetical protein